MHVVLDEFRQALRSRDQQARLLVPTSTMAEHTRHVLAREGFVLQPHWVDTLASYSRRWTRGWREASPSALLMVVRQVIDELALPELAHVSDLPGLAPALARAIDEFSTAGRTPSEEPLRSIHRHVVQRLRDNHLLLRADLLRVAASRVRETGAVWMAGFYTLSEPEREFIAALSRSAKVTVGRLQPTPGAPIEAFRAPTVDREAQAIAIRILRVGHEFREIAVVTRNPALYQQPLATAFHRYGIPCRTYNAQPLGRHPLLRAAGSIIESLLQGWDQERLLLGLRDLGHTQALDAYDFKVTARIPAKGLADVPEPLLAKLQVLESWTAALREPLQWAEALPQIFDLLPPENYEPSRQWADAQRSAIAALRAFAATLAEAAALLPVEPISLRRFWKQVEPALEAAAVPVDDRRRNVVHILTAYEARQWELPVIFICGLADGEFPRRYPQIPFVPDHFRTVDDWEREERELFDQVRANATSLVVMSYAEADPRGAGLFPSPFFDGISPQPVSELPLPEPAALAPAPPVILQAPGVLDWYREHQAVLSASGLEIYQECPFRYFAGRVLRLEPRPPRPEDRLDFLLRGIIVHEVLAKLSGRADGLDQVFAEIFETRCDLEAVPPGYRREYQRVQILEDLRAFLREVGLPDASRTLTEQKFNVALDDGYRLRGRIDRIDIWPDGRALILDYKYSRADRVRNIAQDEAALQGPLYALAARLEWNLRLAGMFFCGVRREPRYGHVSLAGWSVADVNIGRNTGALTPEWMEAARARALEIAASISSGRIAPAPSNRGNCPRCDYRDVCRYDGAAEAEAAR